MTWKTSRVAISAIFLMGCGSSGLGVRGDGGGGDLRPTPGVPLVHRATAMACPTTRPPSSCSANLPSSTCASDADCTAGMNGRCTGDAHDGCACTYDECVTDADCKAGEVCDCRTPGKDLQPGANRCLPSACRVDADCGTGGYCSPTLDPGCGAYTGRSGWYCHTPQDSCTNDADCPMDGFGGGFCGYRPELGHWQCGTTQCAG